MTNNNIYRRKGEEYTASRCEAELIALASESKKTLADYLKIPLPTNKEEQEQFEELEKRGYSFG